MSMILFFVLALFLVLDSLNNQQEPPTPIESRPVSEQNIVSDIPANSEPHLTETNPVQEEPVCTETPVIEPIDTVPIAEYRPVESLESLFIGDSRTVALADYATIEDANFFATVGMTVYNVWDARVSIPQIGKVTLNELLNDKQYDMIYIMLGVNELGYAFDKTVCRYEALVESVQTLQPDAVVILMANIHVTAQRSESDPYINNPAIDRFNEATSRLADSRTVFYLDANSLFDDADGNLAAEKSADSAHLKANYCAEWGDWLIIETADILLQAEGEKESD